MIVMTIKKEVTKLAKAIRKEANTSFVDAIVIAKFFCHKASYDKVKSIPGFVIHDNFDFTHDIDMTFYTINGIDICNIYRRMKYDKSN